MIAVIKDKKFRPLIQGFLESAERFPDRAALVVEGQSVSYKALRLAASQIASAIIQQDSGSLPLAAVFGSRSLTAYASVLGTLLAGRGYVPLNPRLPAERTRRMLVSSACPLLIVSQEALGQLSAILRDSGQRLTVLLPGTADATTLAAAFPQHQFICLPQMRSAETLTPHSETPETAIAYLLFTSGSTGEPKGVPISQANVRSYVDYVAARYNAQEEDRFSQMFDLTFDLSVHDMFVCWERGGCLFSVPEGSLAAPAKFIRENRLTMWFSVPSVVGVLAKMKLLGPGSFPSLRCSLFCGEPLPAAYAQLWQEAAPNSIVENLYGPTETTIGISHYRWRGRESAEQCVSGIVPIGWLFEGEQFLIVDEQSRRAPPGERGELCLAGPQVTRGYWNDRLNTSTRFGPLPEGGEATWYRTGDLVMEDPRGCLHYLGRLDHQVKIRGHRVELQEIEAVLRHACGSDEVVSLPWPVRNGLADSVVAFVSGTEELDQARSLARCREFLPSYMVPRRLYQLHAMPRTLNGKIDRRALAALLEGSEA